MKVFVVQNSKIEGIGLYKQYLAKNKIEYKVFHAYKNDRFPNVGNYDAFIVGGTPLSVNEFHKYNFLNNEWIFVEEIMELNKPYFGICFGGQLLASILGAAVRKNPVMEIGGYNVKLTSCGKKDRLFKGFPGKFPVFQWHRDTFDIPKEARLLVEGQDCMNQAFRYEKTVAVHFHLELTSEDVLKWSDKYLAELNEVNKTKDQIAKEYKTREKIMKKLAYQLLDNFIGLIKNH